VGMALVFNGVNGVIWVDEVDTWPYYTGLVPVMGAWILTPVISAVVCALLYMLVRSCVLRRKQNVLLSYLVSRAAGGGTGGPCTAAGLGRVQPPAAQCTRRAAAVGTARARLGRARALVVHSMQFMACPEVCCRACLTPAAD